MAKYPDSPSFDWALEALAFCDADDIYALTGLEDVIDGYGLTK
jgi:hypothetical protein